MKSKIDFEEFRYVLMEVSGFSVAFNEKPFSGPYAYVCNGKAYPYQGFTLHTNPDYKETKLEDTNTLNVHSESKEMIYTQEMYDNNEAPNVGVKFIVEEKTNDSRIISFHKHTVTVIGLYVDEEDKIVTFRHPTKGIGCGIFYAKKWVKPIDTRTSEEKAIDDLKASFDDWRKVETAKGDLKWLFDDIKAGKISGVSFTGDKK